MPNVYLKQTEAVKLGEEQLNALSRLQSFIKSKDITITLNGPAGSGKTLLTSYFIKYLNEEHILYVLAAPTHKAKLVMETLTGDDALTIHNLLALSPNLHLKDLDMKNLKFTAKCEITKVPANGIVIIDEASMINDALYDYILYVVNSMNSKVVFCGDVAQIQPVNSETLSKVFLLKNTITLTKIYRQKADSPVLDLLNGLRTQSTKLVTPFKGKTDSIYTFNSAKDMLLATTDILKDTVASGNVLNAKIVAYMNNRVQAYNVAARKLIFGDDSANMLNEKDIITGYDNQEYDGYRFYNSVDYIILKKPVLSTKLVPVINLDIKGYYVDVYDTVYNNKCNVFILSTADNNRDDLLCLVHSIESTRLQAIKSSYEKNKLWRQYFTMIDSFATFQDLYYYNRVIKRKTFDYGYALTSYKAQGSSYNTVMVDLANINQCRDPNVLRQLQYVSMSRTRGDLYITQ